jgi:murein DD-endopeptidase MepM/ murein hydrolase activator NlpD
MTSTVVETYPFTGDDARRLRVPERGALAFGATRRGHSHAGLDFPAPEGTPVYAVAGGRAIHSARHDDPSTDCGHALFVDAPDGTRWGYCHLRDPSPIANRATVRAGELVGYVGRTGNARNSGPHLHLQAHDRATGEPIDVTAILRDVRDIELGDPPRAAAPTRPAAAAPASGGPSGGAMLAIALVAFLATRGRG